jgi:hypothetical protein
MKSGKELALGRIQCLLYDIAISKAFYTFSRNITAYSRSEVARLGAICACRAKGLCKCDVHLARDCEAHNGNVISLSTGADALLSLDEMGKTDVVSTRRRDSAELG